jgi:hypothetical protein
VEGIAKQLAVARAEEEAAAASGAAGGEGRGGSRAGLGRERGGEEGIGLTKP